MQLISRYRLINACTRVNEEANKGGQFRPKREPGAPWRRPTTFYANYFFNRFFLNRLFKRGKVLNNIIIIIIIIVILKNIHVALGKFI